MTSRLRTAGTPIPDITEKDLRRIKNKLASQLITSNDPDVKQLLMACIKEITVSNDGVNVTLQI